MSHKLYLRYKCILLMEKTTPGISFLDKSSENFNYNVSKCGQNIGIKMLKDGNTIEAETVVEGVNEETIQTLETNGYNALSEEEKSEISSFTSQLNQAVKQFAGLLKQELHRYDLKDELIGNPFSYWSLEGNQWHSIPRELQVNSEITSLGNLNEKFAQHLQGLLTEDEKPLIATSYLHQARDRGNRRYRWIYATMAAELAIKEILVRIEPKLQVLLEELPSPPLNKLYGDVLESVAGVRSAGLSRLQNGARRRNQLVHNPNSPTPTFDEVKEYINFVEDRIIWLLKEFRSIRQSNIRK